MTRRLLLLLLPLLLLAQRRTPITTSKAMVVSQDPYATDAGVAVLQRGGNAVDAAIATAFALAVTHPVAGNIGGGGFMLIRMADGRTTFLDFRESAPASSSRDMYMKDGKLTRDSLTGPRASGVPGTVRGLELAHQRYGGKLPWKALLDPAIALARDGHALSEVTARGLKNSRNLPNFPESKRVFQRDGQFYAMGDTFKQPDLAATLQRIASQGSKDFYEGQTARLIADFMKANGGEITLADLKAYQAVERKPLEGKYKGHTILTAPPPSSGGIGILQMCAMLEGSGYEKSGAGSAASLHFLAEVQRRYYADRSEFIADPGFYNVPLQRLLDPEYLRARRASINPNKASTSNEVKPANGEPWKESTETTHLSVIDAEGNAVSMTYTLNGGYGSGVTIKGAGFLMNNEMDDFSAQPGVANMFGLVQGEANRIQPGKRPLSSMTPTIVVKDNKPYLIIGAPGGGRIINGVHQVLLNVLDFNMNIEEAINQPRIHHQWQPDELNVEAGISPDTVKLLQQLGHKTKFPGGGVALVEGIMVTDAGIQGAHDRRADGKAAGF